MELEKLEKANEIMAEIYELEKEIDFLLSFTNRSYFLNIVSEKHIFKMKVDYREDEIRLGNEEINTITREKGKRVQKLKEKLGEL